VPNGISTMRIMMTKRPDVMVDRLNRGSWSGGSLCAVRSISNTLFRPLRSSSGLLVYFHHDFHFLQD
jgi:hypothetical protein